MKNYTIGIDLGGTNIRVALVNEIGVIVNEVSKKTEADKGPNFIIGHMVEMIKDIKSGQKVSSIGVGSPGPLDPFRGVILSPPNLPGWDEVPLVQMLQDEFSNLPVYLDNDANAAALAEARLGAGRGCKSVFYITWSTGIGGGFVINDQIFQGAQGYAGEFGNMIVQPNGYKYSSLNPGALEALASGTAIGHLGAKRLAITGGAEEVFKLASKGNKEASAILNEVVDYLAIGIANIVHVINPEVFVIGGGVMQSKDLVFETLTKKVQTYVYASLSNSIRIKPAVLGTKSGVVGASLLGRR